MQKGRICAEHRDAYHILTPDGSIPARISGTLRHAAVSRLDLPAVGDWIAYTRDEFGPAIIQALLPRSSVIVRKAPGKAVGEQIIAANVDWLLIVCGLDGDFNVRRIERYIALAASGGTHAAVLLNKSDVCEDLELKLAEIEPVRTRAPVHVLSALNVQGFDALQAYLDPGNTIALVGSSGAGKSTIANALLGASPQRTGAVRSDDGRGRHTTTTRSLIALPSGAYLIDTPGMRELALWAADSDVGEAFSDIEELAAHCRFTDCAHEREPGCAVQAALGTSLDSNRLANYKKLLREQAFLARKTHVNAAIENKERWKRIHRNARADIRFRKGHD